MTQIEPLEPVTPPETAGPQPSSPAVSEPAETRFLKWVLFGSAGLRVGWAAAMFIVLFFIFTGIFTSLIALGAGRLLHIQLLSGSAPSAIIGEVGTVIALIITLPVLARIERRSVKSYYLGGPKPVHHFVSGIIGGFVALSLLVGTLYKSGFLQFGPATDPASQIAKFGILWGIAFLLVGLSEEGTFRTYLHFTLSRGINFWAAAGCVTALCLLALLNPKGNGSFGVYAMALLGLVPCLILHLKKSASAGFWLATWFTSTMFGYVHTFNPGESWIGIFSAAAIGFVFCVSIRLTGSVWWAIGFHAAWDWAQTFFYGTPDSGLAPQGHFLSTKPMGSLLFSGGTDGPEGSVLVIPIILLTLLALLVIYRRKPNGETPSPAAHAQLS